MRPLLRCCVLVLLELLALRTAAGGEQRAPAAVREEILARGAARIFVQARAFPLASTAAAAGSLEQRRARSARAQEDLLARLPAAHARVVYRYRYSECLFVEVDAEGLEALEAMPEVARLQADTRGQGALLESRGLIRADRVHSDLGVRGEGRAVAVLDSGVDSDHPDLVAAIVHQQHFLDQGRDVGSGAEDEHGHGTNVAGILVGRGVVASAGIAPAASLVAVRVLDRDNSGWLSDWVAGLEHVVDLHLRPDGIAVDAANFSLGTNDLEAEACDDLFLAFAAAAAAARDAGIFVLAAAHKQSSTTEIAAPACLSSVLAVGAVLDTLPDRLWPRTNRNALVGLLAPGSSITSCGIGGRLSTLNGTSQATPHATAVAALVRQNEPELSVEQVRRRLVETGVPVSDSGTGLVFPRLDALAALSGGAPLFRRGDGDFDDEVDLSDSLLGLTHLFLGRPAVLPCAAALDADADGRLLLLDSLRILNHIFIDGQPFPPPFPGCGPDTAAPPRLDCAAPPDCALR